MHMSHAATATSTTTHDPYWYPGFNLSQVKETEKCNRGTLDQILRDRLLCYVVDFFMGRECLSSDCVRYRMERNHTWLYTAVVTRMFNGDWHAFVGHFSDILYLFWVTYDRTNGGWMIHLLCNHR